MSTPSKINSETEQSNRAATSEVQKWDSPLRAKNGSESQRKKIRLELTQSKSPVRKGHVESRFLLRQEKEILDESKDSIQSRRRHFRSIFEAGLNR